MAGGEGSRMQVRHTRANRQIPRKGAARFVQVLNSPYDNRASPLPPRPASLAFLAERGRAVLLALNELYVWGEEQMAFEAGRGADTSRS